MLKVNIRSFSYGQTEILKDIRFELEPGKHLAVLGESGCGKSTLLHLIYGLLQLEKGSLHWGKLALKGPKFNLVPGEPFIKLVAQEFNVMPFITVAENVAEFLPRRNLEKDSERVHELLEVVDLSAFSETMVKHLSGGQKQRVALARALAKQPELLLLDEPFSHIDTFRKNKLRRKLYRYLKQKNIACITATHDSAEALAFSDHLLLLKDGTIEAIGLPEQIYHSVPNIYQAGFFDEVNEFPAGTFDLNSNSDSIILFPHQLILTEAVTEVEVEVKQVFFKGSHHLVRAVWNDKEVFFNHPSTLDPGSLCFLKLNKM
jgi:ABC-type sulfate/molybdate transport systems ATPase subunit